MGNIVRGSTVLLALAAVLFTSAAQAMEIWKFDKMADADQDEYVGDLVVGAEKVLKEEGRPDLAAKVHKLITTIPPGDKISVGIAEFEVNLALARVFDAKNLAKDPKAQRVEVEDAMAATMKKNGIELPDSFFNVMKDFKPKHSPQKK
jgi:hypothetical protein